MIFIVVLAGCGGGGGVMDMSTPTPPVVDDSAKMELAADLAAAKTAIASPAISANKQAELESRINDLEISLQNAAATIDELRMLLAEILEEIQTIKSLPPPETPTAEDCHAINQILINDNCQSCPTNMQFSVNQCVAIPPTAEECYDMQKILVNGNCQSCATNMRFNINQCIPTAESCHVQSQILVGDNCQSCPTNMEFNINQCVVIPPTADECHAMQQILVGDSCQSCPTNRDFINNRCVSIFDTAEYQANPMYESMNALYAYDRGYFGQGVTVAIFELRPGFAVDHPGLAANYITTTINGVGDFRLTAEMDNFHGAAVAGILGAVRNSVGMHGIAPEVKMIPLDIGTGITTEIANNAAYLRDNNIPIINNSYGGGSTRPLAVLLTSGSFTGGARRLNDFIGDAHAIWVWAAGNEKLKTEPNIRPNSNSLYPLLYPRLQTLWLSAIAVNQNHEPAFHTNACGPAKYWCVAAGVYDVLSTDYDEEKNEYTYSRRTNGTSAAAPQVSGALAIFYGAIGMDSPQLARAILLTTATDLGDEGVDDIYGWGLVNISAGIVMIENMESAGTEEFSAVSFANLRGELPSGFAHLHNELSAIKLAIKLTTDLYYNVALSEMLTPGDAPNMPLGDAAAEMLENRGEKTRRGIFAYGDINTELGLRYYGGGNGYSYIAEGIQSATNNFSGNFGGIGGINGKTYGGKFGFTKAIKANMQIFADYERAKIIGKGEEGNLIKGARNARAESWAAGISFADIWKHGDRIKLSANQEMKLSGGELIVRYPHAVGDFHKTFTGEESQKIEIRETFLPLKQKALMLYTAGYSQKFTAKSEWAAALEYNAGNNAKALSLIWQGEF